MKKEINIFTKERYQLVDITEDIEESLEKEGFQEGAVLVFILHSSAGIFITENEEGLKQDFLDFFERIVSGMKFQHDQIDNNADAHIFAGLLGQAKVLPVEEGRLLRGTWQNVFLAEFDGPRERKVLLKFLK